MRQVREEVAAKRVVAQILNERAAVRVGARFPQLRRREAPEPMLEQRGQLPIPRRVDGLEVRDDREGARRPRRQQRSRQGEGEQKAMESSRSLCHVRSNCKVPAEGDLSRGKS